MLRGVTRDVGSGVLLEDLWVPGRTPDTVPCNQLKVLRDIETAVEFIDAVDSERGDAVE